MIEKVLICTSLTDGIYRFVHCISELAAAGFKQITFLHCVPLHFEREIPQVDEERVAAARSQLGAALVNCPGGITVKVEVESGSPKSCICSMVQKQGAELVIVGTAHRTLLDEKLFGSTTAALAQSLDVPLLILRPQLISVYTSQELALRARYLLRCLLIPFDGGASCQSLVRYIQEAVGRCSASTLEHCILCWVNEQASGRAIVPKLQQAPDTTQLEESRQRLVSAGVQVSIELRQGNPIEEIDAVAVQEDISAIAISSEHFGKFWEWSVPSLAGELVRQSWHPVLYVPRLKS